MVLTALRWDQPSMLRQMKQDQEMLTELDLYIWESVCKTLNKWKSEGGSRRPRG